MDTSLSGIIEVRKTIDITTLHGAEHVSSSVRPGNIIICKKSYKLVIIFN